MRTLCTVAELRTALGPARRVGLSVGLVPTMGALHEGHRSLIRRARSQCDVVVVTLFVNPAQFNEQSDLERYPRDEMQDAGVAAEAGADLLFAPAVEEVYPSGFATAVEVLGLTDRLEGRARGAAHFRGVTTVVTKLLCMAAPDTLYLGQKDAQQAVVIARMVKDLNLAVRVEVCPTVRDRDGVALSSRNALLQGEERVRARALPAALQAASASAAAGERDPARLTAAARAELERAGLRVDYVEVVDPQTLEPVASLAGPALLAIAARLGGVRLIDNTMLEPSVVGVVEGKGAGAGGAGEGELCNTSAAEPAGNEGVRATCGV